MQRTLNADTQYGKNKAHGITCTFIHFLAIDPLHYNFRLKLIYSSTCLIILDVIFSI